MRALLIILIFLSACATKTRTPHRFPAGGEEELAKLRQRVERALNPFEVLNLGPAATDIEIERETSKILEQLSGWNLFELTKYTNREEALSDLITLTEKDQGTIKKVVDSYSLWMNMKSQRGFKIGFGRWKWNLGKPDKVEIEAEKLREITIFFKDEFGEYDVRWGTFDVGPEWIPKQTGYMVKFRSMAADPANQAQVDTIKAQMREAGKKGLRGISELDRLKRQLETLINVPDDSMYTHNKGYELVQELEIRYKMEETLPTYLLERLMKFGSPEMKKSCHTLAAQFLSR